jgi:hypothetical protein
VAHVQKLRLELDDPERRKELDTDGDFEGRTGVFTSGIVATKDQHQIALFFTGQKHAGENLTDLLAQRSAELSPPIQMCDGLSRNLPDEFVTLLSRCNAHNRRNFIDVESSFPDEVRRVLETIAQVYRNDAATKKLGLSANERLRFHQEHSKPLLDELEQWFKEQLEQRKIEPNSGLGEAIEYMTDHWDALTLFLRVPGAPLGRVGHWRGGCSSRGVAVAVGFRRKDGASIRGVTPFPVPSRRTGRADFPHPALFRHSRLRFRPAESILMRAE